MRALLYLLASLVPGLAAGGGSGSPRSPRRSPRRWPCRPCPLAAWFERWRLGSPPVRHRWRELGLGLASLLVLWWIDLVMIAFRRRRADRADHLAVPYRRISGPRSSPRWRGSCCVPVGIAVLLLWGRARMTMARELLEPHRLEEVVASRARLVDAFDVERRAGSSETCTTAPSSAWSRCRCGWGWPSWTCRRARPRAEQVASARTRRPGRRWSSCAS
ncbi:hypothetical protein [Nonomuraea dietziae]|uniref:hypothetical protein n=1 Tax=Nonomuraea dietziae TaxID=65515 RepID=UPI0031CEC015